MACYEVLPLSRLDKSFIHTFQHWNHVPEDDITAFKARINEHLPFKVERMAVGQNSVKMWYAEIKVDGELQKDKVLVFDVTDGAFGVCDISPQCAGTPNVWFRFSAAHDSQSVE